MSKDPNNTKWTNDTTSFGHKIMTSQGWTPGQYLGAQDAPHAEFHTEANASHIRVIVKDDNLGIGAKKGSGVDQGECVGLDVFQTLLGRLNADDVDEFEKERQRREDLRSAIYSERKWGTIRFVSGGFLIGDKIQDLIDGEKERLKRMAEDSSDDSSDSSDSDSECEDEATPEPVVKKSKKSKKTVEVEVSELSISKSSKKKRKHASDEDESSASDRKSKKSKKTDEEKLAKKQKKEHKRAKKEIKRAKKAEKAKKKEDKAAKKAARIPATLSAEAQAAIAVSRPILQSGRLAVRARNIEAKRMAAMGGANLNEVSFVLMRMIGVG